MLRDLGCSLLPVEGSRNARNRILAYLLRYPGIVVDGDELMVVSGIGEWARRLRELRVQYGWAIYSGTTFKDIAEDEEEELVGFEDQYGISPLSLKPDQYILVSTEQDREAAHRWNVLNQIRKKNISVKNRLIEYLLENVGHPVTGEELRYLANDKSEWARRTRELRTEDGWPLVTKQTGRPDLSVGTYLLEENRQALVHDRRIPDPVRVEVLKRDGYQCVRCGWSRSHLSPEDPRRLLELHHIKQHAKKGANTAENLLTLCNVCHDDEHRGAK